jgi:hypothetical protein
MWKIIFRAWIVLVTALISGPMAIADQNEADAATAISVQEQAALEVVARRIAAYNTHDIDAYLAAHAELVQIFEYPDDRIGEGRNHLKRIFGPQFARGAGRIEVRGQLVLGNTVVSRESATVDNKVEQLITI